MNECMNDGSLTRSIDMYDETREVPWNCGPRSRLRYEFQRFLHLEVYDTVLTATKDLLVTFLS